MDLCHTAVFMYPVLARVACGVLSSKSVVAVVLFIDYS